MSQASATMVPATTAARPSRSARPSPSTRPARTIPAIAPRFRVTSRATTDRTMRLVDADVLGQDHARTAGAELDLARGHGADAAELDRHAVGPDGADPADRHDDLAGLQRPDPATLDRDVRPAVVRGQASSGDAAVGSRIGSEARLAHRSGSSVRVPSLPRARPTGRAARRAASEAFGRLGVSCPASGAYAAHIEGLSCMSIRVLVPMRLVAAGLLVVVVGAPVAARPRASRRSPPEPRARHRAPPRRASRRPRRARPRARCPRRRRSRPRCSSRRPSTACWSARPPHAAIRSR